VEGTKVSEVTAEAGYDLERVAKNVIEAAFRQLFEDGLFHGDPHPGNILVLPGNGIALLDFGLVGRLSRVQQEALVTLIVAVALRDPESVARVMNRIGVPDAHSPIAEFREDIRHILDRYLGLTLDEIRTATLLRDLLDLAVRHRIRIPKEYAVLAKASITIEGIIRRLYPKLDILEVGLPYAKELLLSRFSLGDASSTLMKSLLKLQGLAEDVPSQLTQILVDLEGGKFRVNVHSEDLERVGGQVRAIGVMLFLGMLAAGLTVGGLVVLATGARTWVGASALGLAFVLAATGALYHVATLRMRKISLRRLLQR
jgi:ubiquinone biosynthesis protein